MELEIIRSIQSIGSPFLDLVFEFITMLGEGALVVAVLTSIYWAIDKRLGEYIGFSFFTSLLVNNFIKDIFKAKRPIGESGIRSLRVETATGYSFPSGHSQASASFYSSISIYKKIGYAIAGVIVLLVGLSRLYLGVHYPKDVVFGILFGILTSYICYLLFNKVKNRLKLYIIILIAFLPVLLINNSPDFIKSFGAYFGFCMGIYFEKKFVNFKVSGSITRRCIRVIIGIILILIIQLSLKKTLSSDDIFDFIRYAIPSFIGIGLYPYIFKKLKL